MVWKQSSGPCFTFDSWLKNTELLHSEDPMVRHYTEVSQLALLIIRIQVSFSLGNSKKVITTNG